MKASSGATLAECWTISLCASLLILGGALVASGCQTSEENPEGSGGTMGLGGEGTGEDTSCEVFSQEHDALLNAPTDAVVVRKKPNIPKAP